MTPSDPRPFPSLDRLRAYGLVDDTVDETVTDQRFSSYPAAILKGIGPLTETRLAYLGIRTVMDLAYAPTEDVNLAGKVARDLKKALQSAMPVDVAA